MGDEDQTPLLVVAPELFVLLLHEQCIAVQVAIARADFGGAGSTDPPAERGKAGFRYLRSAAIGEGGEGYIGLLGCREGC